MLIYLTTNCKEIEPMKEWNLGKFYSAFADIKLTIFSSGLSFPLTYNTNDIASYYFDCDNNLIVRVFSGLFNMINKITKENFCNLNLEITYSGIINYKLLFPYFKNKDLLNRIAKYYEEAEIAFENKSWLSYAIMVGAIFESLLFDIVGKNNSFNQLIKEAFDEDIIDVTVYDAMMYTKNARNLIHSNKYKLEYTSRENAYNIKNALSKVIHSFEHIRYKKLILEGKINERN